MIVDLVLKRACASCVGKIPLSPLFNTIPHHRFSITLFLRQEDDHQFCRSSLLSFSQADECHKAKETTGSSDHAFLFRPRADIFRIVFIPSAPHGGGLLPMVSTNSTRQLHILRHYGYSLAMNGTQVAILEQSHQMCLRCSLKCQDSRGLPTVGLTGQSLLNLSHQPSEGQSSDQ